MPGNAVSQLAGQQLAVNCPNATETVIVTVAPVSTFLSNQRVNLRGSGRFTVGAGATSVTFQWRRDSLTGTAIGSPTASTVVASTTFDFVCEAQDAIAGEIACRTYVLTATVTGGAAAGTGVIVNGTSSVQQQGRTVARVFDPRTFRFNPTCVAGTGAPGTALTADIGRCEIETVRVIIPDGHAGITAIAIEYAGITLLPFGPGATFLVGNNHDWVFPFGNFEVGAPLTIRTRNGDVWDHGWEVHFIVHQIPLPPPIAPGALVLGTAQMTVGIAQGYPDWQRTSQRTGLPIVTQTGVSVPGTLNLGTFYVGNFSRLRIFAQCLTVSAHSLSLSWANTPTDFMFGNQTTMDCGVAVSTVPIRDCVPCQGNWVSIDLNSTINPTTWDVQIIPTDLPFKGSEVGVNAVLIQQTGIALGAGGTTTVTGRQIVGGTATLTVYSGGGACSAILDTAPFGAAAFNTRVAALQMPAGAIGPQSMRFSLPRQWCQLFLQNTAAGAATLLASVVMDL